MRSAGPSWRIQNLLIRQPRAAFPRLKSSGLRLFSKRRTRLRLSTSRSDRSAAFPGRVRQRRRHSRSTERSAERSCVRRSQTDSVASDHKTFRTVARDTDKSRLIPISRPSAGSGGARRSSPSSKGVQPSARVGGCLETPARLTTDISGPSSAPRSAWGSSLNADCTQKRVTFARRVTCKLAPQHEQKPHCNAIGCERDEV